MVSSRDISGGEPETPQDDLVHDVEALLNKFSEEDIKKALNHAKRQSMSAPKLIYDFI